MTISHPPFAVVLRHWLRLKQHAAAPAPQEIAQIKHTILRPRSHDHGQHCGEGVKSILERLQPQ